MKKLANFKNISSTDANNSSTSKRNGHALKAHSKKKHNSPYMGGTLLNGNSASQVHGHNSLSTIPTRRTASVSSNYRGESSFHSSIDDIRPQTIGYTSTAPTVSTERDAAHSVAAQSHGASSGEGTTTTIGGPSTTLGASSTFSSPAPSLRSLTTTLTTMHSTAAALNGPTPQTHTNDPAQSIHFTHQFPISPPPSALPSHLAPQISSGGHPATYTTATANNLLTDNASILTLASSSKRRRRRSMDTDASVRALAPSSLFGGSRESLPLSVLSSTIDAPASALQRLGNERASIYSATGVAPALPSERNSFYAGSGAKMGGDAGSVNSGRVGHGREGSVSGSLSGTQAVGSPLAGGKEREREREAVQGGRLSRTNSGWEGADGGEEKGEEGEKEKGKGKEKA